MPCKPGYHPTPTSAPLGGMLQSVNSDAFSCAPDEQYSSFTPLDLVKDVSTFVLPLVSFPGIMPGAVTTFENTAFEGLELNQQEQSAVKLGISAAKTYLTSGADIMGFFDDLSFDSFGDWGSQLIDEVDWGQAANLGLQAYQTFAVPVASPAPRGTVQVPMPSNPTLGEMVGAVTGRAARSVATVGRRFFDKFPNLATSIQKLRNAGQNITRAKLYSMLKRFGPDFLISAGILTAAAVSELAVAGPGHRRMNPANSKALRRSVRRIKSFHRMCQSTDVLKSRGRRAPSRSCGTCRKSPCRC